MSEERSVCPQCSKPWNERPGWGCRLVAHQTATHNPRGPFETLEPPEIGWGILRPDEKLTPETIALIQALKKLPVGQRDALLTRAIPRYLFVFCEVEVHKGDQPSASNMVEASSNLSSLLSDILGIP